MYTLRKFSASIFAGAAYALLYATGWKRKTVEANLRHVLKAAENDNSFGKFCNESTKFQKLYREMLWNLTHHVGELLFSFDNYKNLPRDVAAYPYKANDCYYELAEGSAAVIEKMRHGGIFLTAHYGNYEASGAWLCALGVPLKASFIPLKPQCLNRFIYENVRCVKGRPYSIDARTPREFLRILDSGELFCLLADQDSRINSAIEGTFLRRPVSLNPIPDFLLNHRQNTPVFFCWIEETAKKSDTKINKCQPRKILHAEEARISCGSINDAYRTWLESRIKENPALWYGWTHKRFKSKNPEIYGL